MNSRKLFLALEAVLFGGPITAIAFVMLPMLYVAIAMASPSFEAGLKGGLVLIGSLVALIEYWRLAKATIVSQRYKFGLLFWLAIPGAFIAALELSKAGSNPLSALWVIVPIAFATTHFSYLQLKQRDHEA